MSLLSHPESRCRYPILAAIVTSTTVLLLGLDPAHAQEPNVKDVLQQEKAQENEQAEAEQPTAGPADEFNRGTPRSSLGSC